MEPKHRVKKAPVQRPLSRIAKYAKGFDFNKDSEEMTQLFGKYPFLKDSPEFRTEDLSSRFSFKNPTVQAAYNKMKAQPETPVKTPATVGKNSKFKNAGMLLPFISNIMNSFQKPMPVPRPVLNNPVALQRVSMDNDRNEIERGVRENNLWFDQNMDAQTAAANKQYTLAQRFGQLSKTNQDERNQNSAISNQETMTNAEIQVGNNAKLDLYNTNVVERNAVMQENRRLNLESAVDKSIGLYDNQQARDLEERKVALETAYDPYGIWKRFKKNNPDVLRMGGSLYSAGSFVRKAPQKRIR